MFHWQLFEPLLKPPRLEKQCLTTAKQLYVYKSESVDLD